MALAPAVRRLHKDLTQLRHARKEGDSDHRDLRADSKKLASQVRELKKDLKAGDRDHLRFDAVGKTLNKDLAARAAALKTFDQQKQVIVGKLAADTFDHDPIAAGVQQDPALLQQLADVTQRRIDTASTFDTRIQGARDARHQLGSAITQDRRENNGDRKAIKHERAVIHHDHAEITHDRGVNRNLRARALSHLQPAEYKLGLKGTNRARHELGLTRVNHLIRPETTNTVKGCAQFLLNSKNVSFWSGLSTGSDRKNLELLAKGRPAFVPATGGHVTPNLRLMQSLVAMAKKGHIMINALTGGHHSNGSNHYRGMAVDLDVSTGNAAMIQATAAKYGGRRNFETDHIHLDF